MHKFFRAIGFSKLRTREDYLNLIRKTVADAETRTCVTGSDDILYGDYFMRVGENIGVAVCGEYNEKEEFLPETAYPYMLTGNVSSCERSIIERHAANVSYAGVCDDNNIGISIIYYLLNRIEYLKATGLEEDRSKIYPVCLTGLSDNGTIMMPLAKDELAKEKVSKKVKKRDKLIKAAREGDEEAIESLTLDDIDVYSQISQKIKNTDVYTLVDTYFMPYGVECDQYSVLGEITNLAMVQNRFTGEEVVQMTINCNGVSIDICINKEDLYGEPEIGRRFKGSIWLQGYLDI